MADLEEPGFQTKISLGETGNPSLCSNFLPEVSYLKISLLWHLNLRCIETNSYLELLLILPCLVVSAQKLQQSALNLLVVLPT